MQGSRSQSPAGSLQDNHSPDSQYWFGSLSSQTESADSPEATSGAWVMSHASPRGWSRPLLPRRCPFLRQPGPPRSYLEKDREKLVVVMETYKNFCSCHDVFNKGNRQGMETKNPTQNFRIYRMCHLQGVQSGGYYFTECLDSTFLEFCTPKQTWEEGRFHKGTNNWYLCAKTDRERETSKHNSINREQQIPDRPADNRRGIEVKRERERECPGGSCAKTYTSVCGSF